MHVFELIEEIVFKSFEWLFAWFITL